MTAECRRVPKALRNSHARCIRHGGCHCGRQRRLSGILPTDPSWPRATPHSDSPKVRDAQDLVSAEISEARHLGAKPRTSVTQIMDTGGKLVRAQSNTSMSKSCYQAVGTVPPSMTNSVPVTEPARGEATNAMRSATSLGLTGRPSGMPPSAFMMACLPPS